MIETKIEAGKLYINQEHIIVLAEGKLDLSGQSFMGTVVSTKTDIPSYDGVGTVAYFVINKFTPYKGVFTFMQ